MLTVERLRSVLRYDPDSGIFTWRVRTGPRVIVGAAAGSKTQGYLNISVDGTLYRAHRLAWLYVHGTWPKNEIDHINGNGCDNRLANLREATRTENMRNQRTTSKSGFRGVTKYRSKWVATIKYDGKKHHLGVFENPADAHLAYIAAAAKQFFEYARKD